MPSPNRIREVLESADAVEQLAAIEHERWAHWQQYVHEQCERQDDGSLLIPAELAGRWQAQIETPYTELSEQEKDSDREQVHRYVPVIVNMFTR